MTLNTRRFARIFDIVTITRTYDVIHQLPTSSDHPKKIFRVIFFTTATLSHFSRANSLLNFLFQFYLLVFNQPLDAVVGLVEARCDNVFR